MLVVKLALLLASGHFIKAEHHAQPTAGPVYTYYGAVPTTAAASTTTVKTTTIPPPPPAPVYDPYSTYSAPSNYDSYGVPSFYDTSYASPVFHDSYGVPQEDSGTLYYYYDTGTTASPETTPAPTTTTTTTTEATTKKKFPPEITYSPLQQLFIVLFLMSFAFPRTVNVPVVGRRKRDTKSEWHLIDPEIIEGLASAQDLILRNIREDTDVCLKRYICQMVASGGYKTKKNLYVWSQDIGPLLGDLGFQPWQYIELIQDAVQGGSQSCHQNYDQCRIASFLQDFNLKSLLGSSNHV